MKMMSKLLCLLLRRQDQPDDGILDVLPAVALCLGPPPLDSIPLEDGDLPDLPAIVHLDPVLPRAPPVLGDEGHPLLLLLLLS